MKKNNFLSIALLFAISSEAISKDKKVSTECIKLTKEHFDSFSEKRSHLKTKLKEFENKFKKMKLDDFIKDVNDKKFTTEHTYPFLISDNTIIAHGMRPIEFFKDVDCKSHERNKAWETIMASIHNASKFPIKVFYHFDDTLKETVIQKVTKDGKTYYLAAGFHLEKSKK